MRMPGFGELMIILLIIVVVFGANKLPRLGEGIGKAIRNFKRGLDRDDELDGAPAERQLAADGGDEPAGAPRETAKYAS